MGGLAVPYRVDPNSAALHLAVLGMLNKVQIAELLHCMFIAATLAHSTDRSGKSVSAQYSCL